MILIDALYINNSGGKVLLDYLVEKLEKAQLKVFYLFDARVKNSFGFIPEHRRVFLKASVVNRYKFYKKNKNNFSKILCFGNIPTPLYCRAETFTYFHQKLFLQIMPEWTIFQKFEYWVKSEIINLLKKNTNFWIVQSEQMADSLMQRYKLASEDVKIIPFYPSLKIIETPDKKSKKDAFVYISNGMRYKNHIRLLKAFKIFFDKHKTALLHLTVGNNSPEEIKDLIQNLAEQNYPIINHGLIPRQQLSKLYKSSRFTIYPSWAESFGLGIIESIEAGCEVIGADLPYMYTVCEPSIVFDPLSVASIVKAMETAVFREFKPTIQKVFNEIDELISLLGDN